MLADIALFMVSSFLLWFGAEWIVDSASAIARRFNVSELVIGLTIVALGTSAPEFLVTATAAFKGLEDISLANVVGSNIFNLGFILGLMALIKPLATRPTMLYRDGLLLFATTALILVMASFGVLGRFAGLLLLILLFCYLGWLFFKPKKTGNHEEGGRVAGKWDYLRLLAGFIGIAAGGHIMVNSATGIALALGVSHWVVGVTIVAAGTSLPELVTCLSASVRGKNEILLGNLLGSDFFNFAGVLGLTCLLRPLHVSESAMPSLVILVAMVGLVLVFIRTGWKVSRLEGGLLVGINLFRWLRDFMV